MYLEDEALAGQEDLEPRKKPSQGHISRTNQNLNLNEEEVSKEELEDGIYYHHYKEMKLEVCGYKKLEAVKNDDFTKLPEYMNDKSLDRARMASYIRKGK